MITGYENRMTRFKAAGIYLVTSGSMSGRSTTPEIIRAALAGGIQLIQLREKELAHNDFITLAREARVLTEAANALLIINDHLDIALEVGADGIHLGQQDMPIAEARASAPDLIIGASSHNIPEAVAAQKAGASYVNIGPLFPTQTKQWDEEFLGIAGLKTIATAINIPFTVMGGIKKQQIPELRAAGAQTIAVVTAIAAATDPAAATRELLALMG